MTERHVGFSGTRNGLSPKQHEAIKKYLSGLENVILHHGDCVGADEQVHRIAQELGHRVVIHPGMDRLGEMPKRADCEGAIRVCKPKYYLERNKDIVLETGRMIIAPLTDYEIKRSGTWSTYRFARLVDSFGFIVLRDGRLVHFSPDWSHT